MQTVVIVSVLIAFFLWGWYGSDVPKKYRRRYCTGREWKRRFPDVPKAEIRRFLSIVTQAFAFPVQASLQFAPDDKILAIYRAIYPTQWMADALELETLAGDIEREYCVDFMAIWNETLTLGELFAKLQQR